MTFHARAVASGRFMHKDELDPVTGCIAGEYCKSLIIYSGYYVKWNGTERRMIYRSPNFLYICPFSINQSGDLWIEYRLKGDIPMPTAAAVGVIHDDFLYQFGGNHKTDPHFLTALNTTNRLYRLDLKTGIWKFIAPRRALDLQPSPRDKAVGFGTANGIYFFGGYGPTHQLLGNEQTFLTDSKSKTVTDESSLGYDYCWTNQLIMFDTDKNCWDLASQGGDVPEPRCSAGFVHDRQPNRGYLYGGTCNNTVYNDLYMLDVTSLIWTKFKFDLPTEISGFDWPTLTLSQNYCVLSGRVKQNVKSYIRRFTVTFNDVANSAKCNEILNDDIAADTIFLYKSVAINNTIIEYGGVKPGGIYPISVNSFKIIKLDFDLPSTLQQYDETVDFDDDKSCIRLKIIDFLKRYQHFAELKLERPTILATLNRDLPHFSLKKLFLALN